MNVHAPAGTPLSRISVKHTLRFAFRFVFRDGAKIWPRVLLPMLAGGIALYGALYLYLFELEHYLVRPNDRIASLVLGLATAGLLVTLFSHSVTTAAITSLALDREDYGWKYFCVSRRAWRTYAAYLRFLLLCAGFIAGVELFWFLLSQVWPSTTFDLCADACLVIGLAILAVRAGYLAGPVAAANDRGRVLREAWRLSSEHSWKLAATLFVIAVPGFGIEAACESLVRMVSLTPPIVRDLPLSDLVANYRDSLPAVVVAVGVAYAVSVVLLVAASAAAYRQITKDNKA
jgi:hypothetical protein